MVPPLDEGGWMKSDFLYANSKVVTQDINIKLNDTIACLQHFNRFYEVQNAMMADLFVDQNKKAAGLSENMQVWNQEDFANVLRAIDTFMDETREDNLTCTQLQVDLRDRADLNRVKAVVVNLANKFSEEGIHSLMDNNWIFWVRGMSFSLQAWSNIFGQRLAKALGLFQDVTELLFLSDRVFPFMLEQIKKVAQEGRHDHNVEERAADWKHLNMFVKGMDLRLNHLKARLATKWAEGAKAVDEMLKRGSRLRKIVVFLWGEISAKRLYFKLDKEIGELANAINRMNLDKSSRYDKAALALYAEKVFTLVEDFGSHENHFMKYKSLDVHSIKTKVTDLRDAYERLCMRLSNFPDDDTRARPKSYGDTKPRLAQPIGVLGKQANNPELNDNFIRNGRIA